jgi:hypothetical protein
MYRQVEHRPAYWATVWIVGIALTAVVFGGLVHILGSYKRAIDDYQRCRANLGNIGETFIKYNAKKHALPAAYATNANGQPLLSWRVLLLPFSYSLDRRPASQLKLDEPWNSKRNLALEASYAQLYHCPYDPAPEVQTSYVAVIGPTTAFRGKMAVALPDERKGQACTLLAVETVRSGIHWMEPRDMAFKDAIRGVNVLPVGGIASQHPYPSLWDGDPAYVVNAVCRDGAVMQLRSTMDPTVLRRLLEVNSPKPKVKN